MKTHQPGDEDAVFALCDQVLETAFALHRYLRHGHLEKVYENGLAHRLTKAGLRVTQQFPLKVYEEDGTVLDPPREGGVPCSVSRLQAVFPRGDSGLKPVHQTGPLHLLRPFSRRVVLGEYFTDLLVEDRLIVELKACKALAGEHTAQLLGYLRACRMEHGLSINFGASRLQVEKYVLSDPQP